MNIRLLFVSLCIVIAFVPFALAEDVSQNDEQLLFESIDSAPPPSEIISETSFGLDDSRIDTSSIEVASATDTETYEFVSKWGSYGSGDGQFIRPEGVAVDTAGNVYITDPGNNRIQKFSNTGAFITKWGTLGSGSGEFSYPKGIAVDDDGNVYVVEESNHRVQKFDSAGNFITKWGSQGSGNGQFERPGGVALDTAGNVYVTDTGNNRIQKFDSTGTFISTWGEQGSGDGQFSFPLALAVDNLDFIYVGDENYRIQKFNQNGTFITKWGSEGIANGKFSYPPSGAAGDDQGNIFVVEGAYYYGGLYRVQKFNSTGSFLTKWGYRGSADGEFQYPKGVAVDGNGFVFVADGEAQRDNHRIQKFSSLPYANFTGEPRDGNLPLRVNFTDQSRGTPTSWSWDFGNENSSEEQHPFTNYLLPGVYNVSLSVQNAVGSNTTIKNNYITVRDWVKANFTQNVTEGPAPLTVQFQDTSTGGLAPPNEWFWAFYHVIDGVPENEPFYNTTVQHPLYNFSSPGENLIFLSVNRGNLSDGKISLDYITVTQDLPISRFIGTPTTGLAPLTVQFNDTSSGEPNSWVWNFGDETTSTEQHPTKIYDRAGIYSVSLNVTNTAGSNTTTKVEYINVTTMLPVANFVASPTSGTLPLVVQFTDRSTGDPSNWLWQFGDGTSSTDQNPQKTYTTAGTFSVSLNVTNTHGSNTETKANYITVTDSPTPTQLVANFTGTPRTGTAPLTVQYYDNSTGNPTNWLWQFGDGTNSTLQSPQKIYPLVGLYNVSLTVTNANGNDSVTKENYIKVTDVPSPANFTLVSRWGSRGSSDNQFIYPDGIVLDSAGNIYVVDSGNDRIQKFDSTGSFITKWGSTGYSEDGKFWMPHGIAVDSDSNIYVTDTWNHRIQKFDSTGVFITKWGTYGSGDGEFGRPWGITTDAEDFVYVADYGNQRIQKFDANGTFLTKWDLNTTIEGQYNLPRDIAVDAKGNVFVSDSSNNNIQKFDANGTFITKWGILGNGEGQFNVSWGIAADGRGNVFVADSLNHRIQIFDNNGTFLTQFGSYGVGEGEFNEPWGIDVNTAGNVYVTDGRNHRVQIFAPVPEGFPVANFVGEPTSGEAPFLVIFTDESTGDNTGWYWDFGDGTTSYEQNPAKSYTVPGLYTVSLTVTNTVGNDTDTKNNYINVSPPAEKYEFVTKWGSFGNGRLSHPISVGMIDSGYVYVADTGNHRIQKFDANGTFIFKWGTQGSGDGQFELGTEYGPSGVIVDADGFIYVADTGNNRIQKFDANGTFITKWGSYGSGDGEFNEPRRITMDGNGNIYAADYGNNRVQKFDANGTFITKFAFSQGSGDGQFGLGPDGIAVDTTGNIYVIDSTNCRVQKFDPSGTFLAKWGSYGASLGYFKFPEDIAVGMNSTVFVADTFNHRIQKFDNSGSFITSWGLRGTGDGEFEGPRGIALDVNGTIYVADSGNNRIQKFNQTGNFITEWGAEPPANGDFFNPGGIVTDRNDNVYVADTGNHRIQKFDANGTFITTWGKEGSPSVPGVLPVIEANGYFSSPSGIALDSEKFVYVADSGNNRIQKFDANGTFLTKWGGWPIGSGDGQFNGLGDIAVNENGFIYVVDTGNNRIQKFDANGTFITKWGSYGTSNGQFNGPVGIAVDLFGNVIVSDMVNHRIQKFDTNGTFISKWASVCGSIAVDDDGSLYITSSDVQKFTSNGIFITRWGTPGSGNGEFSYPGGVAVNAADRVYVADTNNNRIQVFSQSSPPPAPAPIALFNGIPTTGLVPLVVKFTDTSTGNPTSWNWSFGNNDTASVQHPTYTFMQAGNYTVTLRVSNNGGSNSTVKDKYIIIYPKGDFNNNWKVDIGDVSLVAYMVVNREPSRIPDADFNDNGLVDIGDAAKIAYFSVGKITEL